MDKNTDKHTNTKVDEYFTNAKKWQPEIKKLREILLQYQLQEELKWGKPCYVFQQNNIIAIAVFKEHCALMIFKGSLLDNQSGLLVKGGENTQGMRQVRFKNIDDIIKSESQIKDLIAQTIEVEKKGLQIKKDLTLIFPEEFQEKLTEIPELQTAFDKLTQGRKRAYIMYFSEPKQSKTRVARVAKCIPLILDGKGLDY